MREDNFAKVQTHLIHKACLMEVKVRLDFTRTLGVWHFFTIFGNTFVFCLVLCELLSDLFENWIDS